MTTSPQPDRVPGLRKSRVTIGSDFDTFTDEDARDWYGTATPDTAVPDTDSSAHSGSDVRLG